MILLRRALPIVGPLFLIGMFSGLLFHPALWLWWMAGVGAILFFCIALMTKWALRSVNFWLSLFPPASLMIGSVGFLFFLNSIVAQIIFISVVIIFYGIYLEAVFIYYYQPQKYTNLSLSNLSFSVNVFSIFLLSSFGFALQLIRVVPIWILVLVSVIYTVGFMLHMLISYKIWNNNTKPVVMVALLAAEMVWALHFLPTAYYVNGILMAIMLYCVPALIQYHLRDALTKRALWQTISISLIALIVVLSTSQWT